MSDNMLPMFYELNPVIAEENYIIPVFDNHRNEIERLIQIVDPLEFLASFGFALTYMSGWYGLNQRPRSLRSRRSQVFFSQFGNDRPIEKFADSISIMFRARYEEETGIPASKNSVPMSKDMHDALLKISKGLGPSFSDFPIRFYFDYRNLKLTIWNRDGDAAIVAKSGKIDTTPWTSAADDFSLYLKRKIVFAKRVYEEVSARAKSKRVPIEQLLNRPL